MLKIEIKSKTHNYKKQSRRKETKHMYPTLLLTLTTTHVYSELSLKKNSRRYTKRTPLRTRIYIPCGGAQKTQKKCPFQQPTASTSSQNHTRHSIMAFPTYTAKEIYLLSYTSLRRKKSDHMFAKRA